MAKTICFQCGKVPAVGRHRKHRRGVAGKRWMNRVTPTFRLFRPNLQKVTIVVNGEKARVLLCAKCIKRQKFDLEHGETPKFTIL